MKALSDQTEELLKGRTESDAVLKQHIADLARQAEQMTRVFSRPKDRGNWGELQLENVAESVGLRLGVDYVRQQQVRVGNQTLIPDMVVSLPSGSKVVIDSKMPIDQFDKAMQAETEEEQQVLLREHAKAVRKHIDDLSGKQYHHHFKGVDHVILYLPTEALYHTAIEADPDLIRRAEACDVPLEPVYGDPEHMQAPSLNYAEKRSDWQAWIDVNVHKQTWT